MTANIVTTRVLRIVILLLLLTWLFFIIRPFILIVLWAAILAVALFPRYYRLTKNKNQKAKNIITVLFVIAISLLFLVPSYFILESIFETARITIDQIRNNTIDIPEPNEKVKEWPIIGEQLYTNWKAISNNLEDYVVAHQEVLIRYAKSLVSGFTDFLSTFIAFILSFIISIFFMYKSETIYTMVRLFANKLAGNAGEDLIFLSRDTIRSVMKGIILVAVIQAFLAFIGFKAVGLPAAGFFAFSILITTIIQLPALLTMIPAILLAFSITDTTPAILFTVYCIIVSLSDNILKPIFFGKGLKTPVIIILIGTIGGMLLHGIIGLFIGPVVLALSYRLYSFWVLREPEEAVP